MDNCTEGTIRCHEGTKKGLSEDLIEVYSFLHCLCVRRLHGGLLRVPVFSPSFRRGWGGPSFSTSVRRKERSIVFLLLVPPKKAWSFSVYPCQKTMLKWMRICTYRGLVTPSIILSSASTLSALVLLPKPPVCLREGMVFL